MPAVSTTPKRSAGSKAAKKGQVPDETTTTVAEPTVEVTPPVLTSDEGEAAAPPVESGTDGESVVLSEKLSAMMERGTELAAQLKGLMAELKPLKREALALQKAAAKKPRRGGSGAPSTTSYAVKPVAVSAELAAFLGMASGELISRAEVTKAVSKYVKEHDLANPENRRQIVPDATLVKLLKLDPEAPGMVAYLQLQRYLKPHFVEEEAAAASPTASAAAPSASE